MFDKKELIEKWEGFKITMSKDWVEKHDPELLEIFDCNFEEMIYYFASDGLRYLPDGEEPYPIKFDAYSELKIKNLRFLPDIEQEINNLKGNWTDDPCWDIEETEGFEPFKDELLEYSKKMKVIWKNKREKKEKELDQKANELDLEGLYRLILRQRKEIENLQNRIDNINRK